METLRALIILSLVVFCLSDDHFDCPRTNRGRKVAQNLVGGPRRKCRDKKYRDGWHLYGYDKGCCSNYRGCCLYASDYCLYKDGACKCCEYGKWLCDKNCKKEKGCD